MLARRTSRLPSPALSPNSNVSSDPNSAPIVEPVDSRALGVLRGQPWATEGIPMRSKWGRWAKFAAGTLGSLALSAGAQAAFVTFGASGSNATSVAATSDAIDLGSVLSSFTVSSTLGLTVTSESGTTITTSQEGLQIVQGCALAAGSCGASDWFTLTGLGLSLGGTSFTQTVMPTEVKSFSSGNVVVTGQSVESLRLSWDAGSISPAASVGATGSLNVTTEGPTQLPEPGTWALMMAGIAGVIGVGRIARRRP